jgi:hypothetical protein
MTDEQRRPNRKFRLIMGTIAVAVVVSGGAAYAASQDNSPQARSQAIVNDAAGTLGVDPSKLSSALKKALENQVDAQVTAGKLTQAQADAIKKRIEDGTQPIFGGGGPGVGHGFGGPGGKSGPRGHGGPGFRRGGPGGFGGFGLMAGIQDVTTYLGLTPQALTTQLRSGKTLAEIATAQGKTVDGLKAAITTAVTTRLDAAVTAGKLTKDQETKALAALTAKLDDFVNGKLPKMGGFGGGFGHRGNWHGSGKGGTPPAPPAAPAAPAAWAPAPGAA